MKPFKGLESGASSSLPFILLSSLPAVSPYRDRQMTEIREARGELVELQDSPTWKCGPSMASPSDFQKRLKSLVEYEKLQFLIMATDSKNLKDTSASWNSN